MYATFSALAEPNRFRIVELLREGPRPVGEIGARLKLRQPQVSKHLRVLKEVGLVEVEVRAQQRVYELRLAPLVTALDAWLEPYRQRWNASLDALERHLDAMDDDATEGAAIDHEPPARPRRQRR